MNNQIARIAKISAILLDHSLTEDERDVLENELHDLEDEVEEMANTRDHYNFE